MGSCLSCRSIRKQKSIENIIISTDELRKIMIELAEKHEFLNVHVIENEEINDYYDRCQMKNEVSIISDGSENIKFEIFDYQSSNSEDENEGLIMIPKACRNELKRKKSAHLTEILKLSPNQYKDMFLEETNRTEKLNNDNSIKDKCNNPCSIQEVNDISKNECTSLSYVSRISINSTMLNNLRNENESPVSMDNIIDHQKNEYDISFKELFNSNYLNYCQKEKELLNISKSINREKLENYKIINTIPRTYDIIKQDQKMENDGTRQLTYLKDRRKAQELFNLLFHVNKYNQNIIHQLVFTQNYNGMEAILECLVHLRKLRMFLNTVDLFFNTPFAYTVITNDSEMAKILLSYGPKIPEICYSTTRDNWMPILHNAYQSAIRSSGENIFILICNYLLSLNNTELLQNILETRDIEDQTILHHIILDYNLCQEKMDLHNVLDYNFYIKYLLNIGANLEAKCPCPSKYQIRVDALGQAIFGKYPLELLEQFMEFHIMSNIQFTWHYVIDNISYSLDELFLLRTDLNLEYKRSVISILEKLK